jgi:cysteinyl-tRNA synthetase
LKKSPEDSSMRALLIGSANLVGILKNDPIEWFESKNKDVDIEMVNNLIEKRRMAREEKDYEKGDLIRDQLLNMGIFIEDTQEGPVWKKISIND